MPVWSPSKAAPSWRKLIEHLASQGRWIGPDPVTRSITTMGGVLATNGSGSHYLRSGSARDCVESMRVVTIDGELIELATHRVGQ